MSQERCNFAWMKRLKKVPVGMSQVCFMHFPGNFILFYLGEGI